MSMEDKTSNAMWFVAGAAVGATLALLFAPSSGVETRRRIRRTAERSKDRLSDVSHDLMDKGRELYERGRDMADDAAKLFERGKKMVEG
jgi:gas vesicle protein